MCGGGSSTPDVPAPTPIPAAPTEAKTVTAREKEEAQIKRARGAKSTILTSGLGVGSEANTSKPTLLGQ